jgi:hypothetical protein
LFLENQESEERGEKIRAAPVCSIACSDQTVNIVAVEFLLSELQSKFADAPNLAASTHTQLNKIVCPAHDPCSFHPREDKK